MFNGIVYHIFDPLSALREMAAIARCVLTVETFMDNIDNPRPVMVFFPGEQHPPGHPQNGWGANSYCMHAILNTSTKLGKAVCRHSCMAGTSPAMTTE
jgi:tRNA (mo5U34)-methyltransferase